MRPIWVELRKARYVRRSKEPKKKSFPWEEFSQAHRLKKIGHTAATTGSESLHFYVIQVACEFLKF